ncbi:MAG TPA: efflux transporter outer membrane subunit [Syntrophales bacterium]|nr:efflux transporter outer membrane subunit [Syntrophales bacterium]
MFEIPSLGIEDSPEPAPEIFNGESPNRSASLRPVFAGMTAALALLGCAAAGPDFRPPDPPAVGVYTPAPLPAETAAAAVEGGAAQRFVHGQDIPAEWWALFRSPSLDGLIREALAGNPTLALAQARIREARETRLAQFGALLPSVDAEVSASRQKISGVSLGQADADRGAFSLFNASVNVSYSLDLFGGTRRRIEALEAEIEYRQFQLEGIHITLTANVVTTAVKEASLRSQIRATREILAAQEKQLELAEQRLQLGGASRSDVLVQQAQLALTRAALPPLERDLEQTRHQLAVLVGRSPGEAALPEFELAEILLPGQLPVSVPSILVRQRPDIRAAEALLHAANAAVGAATADLYPQVTLSGRFGTAAETAGGLFDGSSAVWSLGAGLLQPLFRGGALTAQRRAAVAVYDQAVAQYRETVLEAFRNVADVLRALDADARELAAQAEADRAAQDALVLTRAQFEIGAVSYLSLLIAQSQQQAARIGLVRAQAARLADTAALFQAMGGGWWNRRETNGAAVGKAAREQGR